MVCIFCGYSEVMKILASSILEEDPYFTKICFRILWGFIKYQV